VLPTISTTHEPATDLGFLLHKNPERVHTTSMSAHLPVLPCRGGEGIVRRLFEPLGYEIDATAIPLDATFPT